MAEGVLVRLWAEAGVERSPAVSAHDATREAMERYGIDRPDLRYGLEIRDLTASRGADASPFLAEARIEPAAGCAGSAFPAAPSLSRKQVDELEAAAKSPAPAG